MSRASEFQETVMLQRPVQGSENALGHAETTFEDLHKCAARVWTSSYAEQSFNPAEFGGVQLLRLLLRLPPKSVAVGWGVVYSSTDYRIAATESRDDDLLVTLEPR